MEKSDSIKELVGALVKFQTHVGKIKKDSNNPFFKSKYAALPDILDVIQQPLIECGLTINQFPTGTNGLTTILSHTSGEYMMDTYIMNPAKNDPQGIGSCITYQRRYALGAVLSLNIDEDDDGNAASGNTSKPASKAPAPAPAHPALTPGSEKWAKCVEGIASGVATVEKIRLKNTLSDEHAAQMLREAKILQQEKAAKI